MTTEDQQISRRGFLKGVAVTGAAAVATGAGAATLMQQSANAPITTNVVSTPPLLPATAVPNMANISADEMLARLASAQAENVRLQAALDAANRQLLGAQADDQNALAAQETYNVHLAEANNQIGVLAGLIALYEQLDSVDVDAVVENGLTAVSETLNNFMADVPTLEESLEMGQIALAEVENHIPLLDNGRLWLENHNGKLDSYFKAIELILLEVVESAGPFLDMLNSWFESVKKWLPFGLGEKATNVMQSITTLLLETPATISGLNTNVAQPLDVWLAKDQNNEVNLQKNLIKPLRENVIAQSNIATGKAKQVESIYKEQLHEPINTAVASQRVIRNLIAEYRENNQV